MTIANIIAIILAALLGAAFGVAMYYKTGKNIYSTIVQLIGWAQTLDVVNEEKMNEVVEKLYENLPSVVSKIVSKQTLRNIAQAVYDQMKNWYKEKKEQEIE